MEASAVEMKHLLAETSAAAAARATAALTPPQIATELARLKATKGLRRTLHQLCVERGGTEPVLAFDRWLARCKLAREAGGAFSSTVMNGRQRWRRRR